MSHSICNHDFNLSLVAIDWNEPSGLLPLASNALESECDSAGKLEKIVEVFITKKSKIIKINAKFCDKISY